MPKLVISLPDGSDQTHDLKEEKITVGRVSENMIFIEDVSVSSFHAELVLEGSEYLLRDLNSTNGTRVNGQNITEAKLGAGDIVRFGKIEARYQTDASSESRPLPKKEEIEIKPASSSVMPTGFHNASPFKTKGLKKDPAAKVILGFAVLSIVAFLGALASIFLLQPPT